LRHSVYITQNTKPSAHCHGLVTLDVLGNREVTFAAWADRRCPRHAVWLVSRD